MLKKIAAVCLGALVLSACGSMAPPPVVDQASLEAVAQSGRIIDLRTQATLTPAQLAAELAQADIVMVGEKHDQIKHHQMEQWLVATLPQQRPQGSFVLEMLQPKQQDKVTKTQVFLSGGGHLRMDKVVQATDWQKGWNWAQYRDLVNQLLRQPAPVLEANLDREPMMQIYKDKPILSGALHQRSEVKAELAKVIDAMHEGADLDAMIAVQQHRDRKMAEAVMAAPKPTMLVAGAYHVVKNLGAPLHLRDLGNQATVKVLILAQPDAKVLPEHADYVWYAPQ
ncbi:MAG: ChaN family lipoprotein [Neisseriaceae bacterium]|nr:ChaN family lipoprotein [Neisseriaceae bacterium]